MVNFDLHQFLSCAAGPGMLQFAGRGGFKLPGAGFQTRVKTSRTGNTNRARLGCRKVGCPSGSHESSAEAWSPSLSLPQAGRRRGSSRAPGLSGSSCPNPFKFFL